MRTTFRFFGFSAFHIVTGDGASTEIAPNLNDNPVTLVKADRFDGVDLVFVNHGARFLARMRQLIEWPMELLD